ncbi:MAG: ribose-phosphate pyrophosphokinase, partial [Acidithiobacillales bacterium SM1_46]
MPKQSDSLAVFAVAASREFGERVAQALGQALGAHEEREFEDGEHKIRPLKSVRGRDVYVIQSLYSDSAQSANDKLCRMLFFLGALRDAGAARTTAVMPYLAYARKDQKSQTRDPVTTRYVAQLIESVGVDRVVTLDVH